MYLLMSIDALARIALAIVLMFVVVPLLAWPRRKTATVLEWFFWNLGVGIALLTLLAQILTLARLFSLLTLSLIAALIILLGRSTLRNVGPWILLRQTWENAILATLNVFDGRIDVRRRIRRSIRRAITSLRSTTASQSAPVLGWVALTAIAAALRLYRPLVSANLGFSDTYVHLYLLKLLEDGQQVDPAWGPYPRGMHFLLLAIHELTNVDHILLMNFFGVFVGVLMTLAVADSARRLSNSVVAGLVSGLLFATLVGGAGQYFLLGGSFEGGDRFKAALPYEEVRAGEFDIALTDFQRQTSTLSQELAIALLFPAVMFLLDFLKKRERWHLFGFIGCTAAIAAVHSGVLVPLILMSAVAVVARAIDSGLMKGAAGRAAVAGAAAIIVGSSWALAFIAYPYSGGKGSAGSQSPVASAALYYFPLLRGGAGEETPVFVALTPFLIVCIVIALVIAVVSLVRRDERRGNLVWISIVFLLFLLIHFASVLGLPQIVEMRRNSQWLLMAMAVVLGIALAEVGGFVGHSSRRRMALATAAISLPLIAWISRVPRLSDPAIHDRIVNYSGYGASALAVLRIERNLEPFTWTIVSYGQEFPMVMRRGFHLPAADFLERYDPNAEVLPIPTPHVFIIVEKTPHPFQINTWARRFSRSDLEQRLQTWVHLYQMTHSNMRVHSEDESVRVYEIRR